MEKFKLHDVLYKKSTSRNYVVEDMHGDKYALFDILSGDRFFSLCSEIDEVCVKVQGVPFTSIQEGSVFVDIEEGRTSENAFDVFVKTGKTCAALFDDSEGVFSCERIIPSGDAKLIFPIMSRGEFVERRKIEIEIRIPQLMGKFVELGEQIKVLQSQLSAAQAALYDKEKELVRGLLSIGAEFFLHKDEAWRVNHDSLECVGGLHFF